MMSPMTVNTTTTYPPLMRKYFPDRCSKNEIAHRAMAANPNPARNPAVAPQLAVVDSSPRNAARLYAMTSAARTKVDDQINAAVGKEPLDLVIRAVSPMVHHRCYGLCSESRRFVKLDDHGRYAGGSCGIGTGAGVRSDWTVVLN